MTREEQFKMLYQTSSAGHQVCDYAQPPVGVSRRVQPTNMIAPSATSAFRPAGANQVPYQQPGVSQRLSPASGKPYYHQQQVAARNVPSEQPAHPKLMRQQEHLFQNAPGAHSVNRYHGNQRHVTGASVRPHVPVMYQQEQQFAPLQERSNPEALHEELRMLHAMHYQEKMNRKEELDNMWKQSLGASLKMRGPPNQSPHAIYEMQRREKCIPQGEAYQKHPVQRSPGTYQQQPQHSQYVSQDELYPSRRNQFGMNSSLQSNRTTMPPSRTHTAEMKSRENNMLPQGVVQPGHASYVHQYRKEYMPTAVHRVSSYPNYVISKQQRYYAPTQPLSRASTEAHQYQRCVPAPYSETFGNLNTSQEKMLNMQSEFEISQHAVKPKLPEHARVGITHDFSDVILIPDSTEEKKPKVVTDARGSGFRYVGTRGTEHYLKYPSESKEYPKIGGKPDQGLINSKGNQVGYEGKRLSNAAVCIKHEQLLLKEELELSLQRAAMQSVNREVKSAIAHESPEKCIVSASSDVALLPKIVKVQSLAGMETGTFPASELEAPNRELQNVAMTTVGENNGKHAKPKSRMIKSHHDLYEIQSSIHRVSSRGSMDSETGRKDSWDSGIESPPWPEVNREANALNLTRGAAFSLGDVKTLCRLEQGQRVKQEDTNSEMSGLDLSIKNAGCLLQDAKNRVKCEKVCSSDESAKRKECQVLLTTSSTSNQLSSGHLQEDVCMDEHTCEEVNVRKRTWSSENLCPVETKVLHKVPEVLDISSGKALPIEKTENGDCEQESAVTELIDTKFESPLDLSIKKQKPSCLEGAGCVTHDEKDDQKPCSSESQGYFGSMMMRVLKRLWSSKDEVTEETPKQEATESTDDDPAKYFRPGATLSSTSSFEPLENALCQLMQQSSGTFNNWADIFEHFDVMIKRELFLEMQSQQATSSEATTSSETENAHSVSEKQKSDLKDISDEQQTSEAVALCSDAHISEEIYNTTDLVIVESSWSPVVSPDSQESSCRENEAKTVPDRASESTAQPAVEVADSSVSESFSSQTEIYERAARDAARKAARLAAEKAAKQAPERIALGTNSQTLPQNKICRLGNVTNLKMMSAANGVPSQMPTTPLNNYVPVQNVNNAQCLSPGQLEQNRQTALSLSYDSAGVERGTACKRRDARVFPHLPYDGRSFSEPVTPKNYHQSRTTFHEAPEPLQRACHENVSYRSTPRNIQSIPPHIEVHGVSQYRKIVPKPVQTQIRVMTAPSAQAHQVHAVEQYQLASQKDFHRSPIILLPKMACVPGQMYQESQFRMVLPVKPKEDQGPLPSGTDAAQGSTSSAPCRSSEPSSMPSKLSDIHQSVDYIEGPFQLIKKTPPEPQSKKPFVSAFLILYRDVTLPGVVRSGIPFVPPRMLQEGLFPEKTFDEFCSTLHECSIMQRYMTVLERAALLSDLKHNKISSCKLVSLEEIHQKYDAIKVHLEGSTFRRLVQAK